MKFDGRVALITGGGSGIGRATAIGFAQRSARVAVVDIDGDAAFKVAVEITASGGNALAVVADLANSGEIDAMVARTIEVFGRLDVLHNNAYGAPAIVPRSGPVRLADLDQTRWDHAIQIGLTAVMQAIKVAVPIMRKQGGGVIVNTSSVAGLFADVGTAAYQHREGWRD
jgi:NAD(P)-dependent dehydrogenase (short-subunit alcohol dehydrogenase family)